MPIQTHTPVRIGTGFPPKNNPGSWAVLIPVVTFTSVWCMVHFMFVDVLPSALVLGSIQLELGIGPTGKEVRAWKSIAGFSGGSELEFDDSGWTKYVPFNFQRDVQVSARFAGINQSFGHNLEIQLQLYS